MKSFIRRSAAPCLLLGLSALASCGATRPYAVRSIDNDTEAYASVVAADASLAEILEAGKPRVSRVADNCLQIMVPLRNIDDEQIQVLAQVEFRDRDQLPLDDLTNRQVMIIPAGATVTLTSTSRSDAASDYVVRLFWNK